MIRTALAIAGNWILGTAFVLATGIYDPWLFSLLLDAACAFIILHQPAGKMQALIGSIYLTQILTHFVYSFSNHDIAAYSYWQLLTLQAFVQLALLGGWIGGHWGRRYLAHRRHPFGSVEDDKSGLATP